MKFFHFIRTFVRMVGEDTCYRTKVSTAYSWATHNSIREFFVVVVRDRFASLYEPPYHEHSNKL